MNENNPPSPVFPQYPNPNGLQIADKKQAGPLNKMISRMLPKKLSRAPKSKGIHTNQSVKINHKKIKFY